MPKSKLSPRAAEMLALLRRHVEGGATLDSLAAEVGVKRSTLVWWKSQLRDDLADSCRPFVEVAVCEDDPSFPRTAPTLSVLVGDLRVEVAPDFDERTLVRIVGALRRC
jgi:transposase-like protein